MYNLRHSTATLVWYLIIYVMLVSCGQKPAKISLAERKAMDSIVSSSHNIDTLSMIQKRMEREGNVLGSIVAYRAMGKELRNDSRFDEALKVHSEGLKLYNPQNEMFPPRKTKCSKRKTKCICFRHPPKPYKK